MFGLSHYQVYWGLYDSGWIYLAMVLCIVSKLFCSKKTEERDYRWMQKWARQCKKRNRLLQREVYLLEEMDKLRLHPIFDSSEPEQKASSESLSSSLQESLNQTAQELWLYKQACDWLVDDLRYRGPWALGRAIKLSQSPDGPWYMERIRCKIRGGCCERECGCCEKPRRTMAGKTTKCWNIFYGSFDFLSHCSEECGCCRRERGFKSVVRNDDGSLTCLV
jgi:hypothetical protein